MPGGIDPQSCGKLFCRKVFSQVFISIISFNNYYSEIYVAKGNSQSEISRHLIEFRFDAFWRKSRISRLILILLPRIII